MSRLKHIVAVIVVVCAAAILWLQYSFNERLWRDNEVLRRTIAGLKQVQKGREPISDESVTREQLDELSKLRSEAARLREQTNQIGALEDANQKLTASLMELKVSQTVISKKKGPEDALPQNIHPKESWAFRGYGSPDDTVESMAWAVANGDRARFLAGMAPELRALWEKQFSETELTDDKTSEFRVLDRQSKSDDLMMLIVYTTRKGTAGDDVHSTDNVFFKRIDSEWRVADSAVTPQ